MLFMSPSVFVVPSATVPPGLIIGRRWCSPSRQLVIQRLHQLQPEQSSGFRIQDQFRQTPIHKCLHIR